MRVPALVSGHARRREGRWRRSRASESNPRDVRPGAKPAAPDVASPAHEAERSRERFHRVDDSRGRTRRRLSERRPGVPGSRCYRAPARRRVVYSWTVAVGLPIDQSPTIRVRQSAVWPSSRAVSMAAPHRISPSRTWVSSVYATSARDRAPCSSALPHPTARTDTHSRVCLRPGVAPVARGLPPSSGS